MVPTDSLAGHSLRDLDDCGVQVSNFVVLMIMDKLLDISQCLHIQQDRVRQFGRNIYSSEVLHGSGRGLDINNANVFFVLWRGVLDVPRLECPDQQRLSLKSNYIYVIAMIILTKSTRDMKISEIFFKMYFMGYKYWLGAKICKTYFDIL